MLGGQWGGSVPAPGLEQEAFQRSGSRDVAEARQRLFLDLPDALPRDTEQRADLLERHGLLALQPEMQAEDLRLPLLEGPQHPPARFGAGVLEALAAGPGFAR